MIIIQPPICKEILESCDFVLADASFANPHLEIEENDEKTKPYQCLVLMGKFFITHVIFDNFVNPLRDRPKTT